MPVTWSATDLPTTIIYKKFYRFFFVQVLQMQCATKQNTNRFANISDKSSAVVEMGDHGHNRHEPKREGDCCAPSVGGARSPSNTMWSGPRSTSVPSGVFIHPAVWPQETWAKNWVGVVPFFLGAAGSPSNTKTPGLRPTSTISRTSVHPDIGRKLGGGCAPLGEGDLGPYLTQCCLGRGLPPYQVAS